MLHSYWLENGCLIFLNIFLYVCLHLLNAKRKPQVSRLSSKNFLKLESGSWRYEIFFSQCFQNLDSLKESFKFTHEFFFLMLIWSFHHPPEMTQQMCLGPRTEALLECNIPRQEAFGINTFNTLINFCLVFDCTRYNIKTWFFSDFKGCYFVMILKVHNSI